MNKTQRQFVLLKDMEDGWYYAKSKIVFAATAEDALIENDGYFVAVKLPLAKNVTES